MGNNEITGFVTLQIHHEANSLSSSREFDEEEKLQSSINPK